MAVFRDIGGQKFGRLTTIGVSANRARGVRWVCRCDCGNFTEVSTNALTSGRTKSCGCLWKDTVPGHNASHRRSGDYLHRTWGLMIQRCCNPRNPAYPRYGGRGIRVCESWRHSFQAFAADVGERPSEKHTIERKDNDSDYCPKNCYWGTAKDQARNRRSSRLITFNGETKTAAEWSETTGIASWTIRQRIDRYGWSAEKALTTPTNHLHHLLTFKGETKNIEEWAAHLGIPAAAIAQRLNKLGWPVEKALSTPVLHGTP